MQGSANNSLERYYSSRCFFLFGFLLSASLLFCIAEIYLRLFPPVDIFPFMGDDSPLHGIYKSDPEFIATYRSWEDFVEENRAHLEPYMSRLGKERHERTREIWTFFGNSYAQGPGMLCDKVTRAATDIDIFYLRKNDEPLIIRLAQIKLLLEQGLVPNRIFLTLLPVDFLNIGLRPLEDTLVNAHGAITYTINKPVPPFDWLVDHSRLVFTAWIRSGYHQKDRGFWYTHLYQKIPDRLWADVTKLLVSFSKLTESYDVPVTFILIPEKRQTVNRDGFEFQNVLTSLLNKLGFDVFDPRNAFMNQPNPMSLYIPDWHLSEKGNRLLRKELFHHIGYIPPSIE